MLWWKIHTISYCTRVSGVVINKTTSDVPLKKCLFYQLNYNNNNYNNIRKLYNNGKVLQKKSFYKMWVIYLIRSYKKINAQQWLIIRFFNTRRTHSWWKTFSSVYDAYVSDEKLSATMFTSKFWLLCMTRHSYRFIVYETGKFHSNEKNLM